MADTERNFQLLKSVEFLGGLPERELRRMAAELDTATVSVGTVICRQGDADGTFFILKRGKVEVTAKNEQGEVVLRTELKAGEFFGEFSLVTGEPRSATCTATEEAELLGIGKPQMKSVLAANRDFSDFISGVLAWRQYRLEMRMGSRTAVQAATPQQQEQVAEIKGELQKRMGNYFAK